MLTALLPQPAWLFALAILGILLMYVEANRPGRVIPGCLGLLTLLVTLPVLFTPAVLPLSLFLLLAGFGLCVLQAWLPVAWIGTLSGVTAMSAGMAYFYAAWPQPNPVAAVFLSAVLGFATSYLFSIALRARRAKRVTIH